MTTDGDQLGIDLDATDQIALELLLAVGQIIGVGFGIGGAAAAPQLEQAEQYQRSRNRTALIGLGDLAEASRRGEVSAAEIKNVLDRYGLSERAQAVLQAVWSQPLAAPVIIEAWRRGELEDAAAIERLGILGLAATDARTTLATATTLLTPDQLLALWRRDELTEAQLDARLAELGFRDDAIADLKRWTFQPATPSDVTRFAVREVYSLEAREALGLDAGFPQDAIAAFRAAGLSEQYARDTWAAHWRLPSVTQSYRMFWRGEIGADDLELILRASDYLPRFIGPQIETAYRVPTRVDIRRLVAGGFITGEEAIERYRDLGYAPEDADRLGNLAVQLAETGGERVDTTVRNRMRDRLLRLYRDGVLSESDAVVRLTGIGIAEVEAESYLAVVDLDLQLELLDASIETAVTLYQRGELSEQAFVGRLDALDVTPGRRDHLRELADLEVERRVRLPSRAELDRMLRIGEITPEEHEQALVDDGWPPEWAARWTRTIAAAAGEEEE